MTSTFVFLIAISIGLFRYMGLHQAFKHTPSVRKWKLKQQGIFGLYLFFIVIMISGIVPHGEILTLFFFFGLLYIGIRSVMNRYKNFNVVLPSLLLEKRLKNCDLDMKEIDKMSGREFELFVSELYKGLGYYTEVTPTTGDFGIDVLTTKDNIKAGIQSKRYKEGRKVGLKAVNEVVGGSKYWKVRKNLVVTNSYFTKNALILAKANKVEMLDRDGLVLLIKEYQKISNQRRILSFFSFLNGWKHS